MDMSTLPDWAKKAMDLYAARVNHAFCFHFNVTDLSPLDGEEKRIADLIIDDMLGEFDFVLYYDLASKVEVRGPSKEQEKANVEALKKIISEKDFKAFPPKNSQDSLKLIEFVLSLEGKSSAIVIGYAETIFPAQPQPSEEEAEKLIRMIKLARNKKNSNSIIVLLAANQAALNPALRLPASEIEFIQVPMPTTEQRLTLLKKYELAEGSEDVVTLAEQSRGMTLSQLSSIARQSVYKQAALSSDEIWVQKKVMLEQATGGLIEVIKPQWDGKCVGGLQEAKNALNPIIKAVREGNTLAVPMGILFMGPPGTGKSLLAEVISGELGFPMVVFQNIKSKWVGESEQQQSLVLEYIENLAPVVVFQDEFDQTEQKRGTGESHDAGVTENLRAQKMEFMARSDLRGSVLWLSATNRPDLLDAAFLRPGRFDLRIPFLPPLTPEERVPIFRAIFAKMVRKYPPFKANVSDDDLLEISKQCTVKKLRHGFTLKEDFNLKDAILGYSGADIERVCHKAWELSLDDKVLDGADLIKAIDDYSPDRTEDYLQMLMAAIDFTNFCSVLPANYCKILN